jgi:hypothetical protein
MVTEGLDGIVAKASSPVGNALERAWSRRAWLRQIGARFEAEKLARFLFEPGEALADDLMSLLRSELAHLPKYCKC